ncbi:uncharacterized protein LOC122869313 isoform X2 [Siniperca chuatsi]|uniref:uncharacterized protein LOC122869313 isoform X2 n=1 Tax=Siniperca chuatsi TaxID=119488 RepID=UPI001CE17009|nr:uncharacterized protein LOC122869313 isoform X2 [Siniperca chuatsi]
MMKNIWFSLGRLASLDTVRSKRSQQKEHQRTVYFLDGQQICQGNLSVSACATVLLATAHFESCLAVDPQHCHNSAIYRSSNLPDCVKSAKLRKQEQHLCIVGMERQAFQDMVNSCRATVGVLGVKLGPNPPCSRDLTMDYSFDYAQQVHYPSDPLQPGPMYFLVPCKCGVFGVCCEGVPQQFNYLIDEGHCISKGSNAVIAYLHHFLSQYGLGEKHVLHCDNCSGQNKNKKFMLWYLAWQCMVGLHDSVPLNFLKHRKHLPGCELQHIREQCEHPPAGWLCEDTRLAQLPHSQLQAFARCEEVPPLPLHQYSPWNGLCQGVCQHGGGAFLAPLQ